VHCGHDYISCDDVSSEQLKKVMSKFLSPEDNSLYIPIHIGSNNWCAAWINVPGKTLELFDLLDHFWKKQFK
jgi:Ulp1 family protease